MRMMKAFRYRLKPTKHQLGLLSQFSGSCRFAFNHGLARTIEAYTHHKKKLSYSDLCGELTLLKQRPDKLWLTGVHSQLLQQALKDLQCAFSNFLRRLKNKENPGFPKFKKKGMKDSFRYPQGVKTENGCVYLPKIGWVRYYDSRPREGTILQTTVKREGNYWFVSLSCEVEHKDIPLAPVAGAHAIGIDVGISHFATLSDGSVIENPRFLTKALAQLRHQQRSLSRKQKGSANCAKQRARVAQCHINVKNARKDFLHKLSTRIVKNHDVIAVETLHITGMLKNHTLARAISDVSWYTFFSMLEYKARWLGKHFVTIGRFFPSTKMCSFCHQRQAMPLARRVYECSSCGLGMDRDLNASINIRAAGLAVLTACRGIKPELAL